MTADNIMLALFILAQVTAWWHMFALHRVQRENRKLHAIIDDLNAALGKANDGNKTLQRIVDHWKAQAAMKRIVHGKN